MTPVRFAGVEVELGGEKYIVPALALRQVKEFLPRLKSLDLTDFTALSPEVLDTLGDLVLAALNRNYPDMTREQLDDVVDLGNMSEVVKIVLGQSGIVEKKREITS